MAIWSEIKDNFRSGNYLTRLIYINVGVFLVINILIAILTLTSISTEWVSYLEMPASVVNFIYQPWSLLTYMFLHTGFLHLMFNMLALYWFGKFFLEYYNQKQLTSLYIIGGIIGAIFYMLAYNSLPYFSSVVPTSYLLGASASVMAIIFAPIITDPDKYIRLALIGNIKLKYLGLIFLAIDLIGVGATNAGGSISHLGGAAAGCIFALLINKKGIDICKPINAIIGFFANLQFSDISMNHKPKMKVKPQGKATDAEWNAYNNTAKKENNARIDQILEKIKKSGYAALTAEEKKELFELSNNK